MACVFISSGLIFRFERFLHIFLVSLCWGGGVNKYIKGTFSHKRYKGVLMQIGKCIINVILTA